MAGLAGLNSCPGVHSSGVHSAPGPVLGLECRSSALDESSYVARCMREPWVLPLAQEKQIGKAAMCVF